MDNILAVDIGGTAIKSAIFSPDGSLLSQLETPNDGKKGAKALMETVFSIVSGYEGYSAIGVSTAGLVNSKAGYIVMINEKNIPGYTDMAVGPILSERFHVPVAVENDVNAAALGEAHYGGGRGVSDFICLTYGTGVGGAIVTGGNIYNGWHGLAGEMGHMIVHAGGRPCGCGCVGCYEQYAATTALVRAASAYNPAYTDGRAIFAAFGQDAGLHQIVDQWIDEILLGLATLTHIFNPELFLLGGGVMSQSYIMEKLREEYPRTVMPDYKGTLIRPTALKNTAGMYGAMHLAKQLVDEKRRG